MINLRLNNPEKNLHILSNEFRHLCMLIKDDDSLILKVKNTHIKVLFRVQSLMLAILKYFNQRDLTWIVPPWFVKKKSKYKWHVQHFSYLQVRDCIFNSLIFLIGENRRRVERIRKFQGASDGTDTRIHWGSIVTSLWRHDLLC